MGIRSLLSIFLLCNAGLTLAQQSYYNQRPEFLNANSVWAFGDRAGINFNSGGPVSIETDMLSLEGSASVADRHTGDLLFYSNGGKVWNANHQVMPNGSGLLGNPVYYGMGTDSIQYTSTVQGVCIIPAIEDTSKYYLFSLSGTSSGGPKPEGTLFYSVVDMNLENGLGNVAAGQKNVPLDTAHLFEGMVAVPGNNCDVWLIVHHASSHEFRAYHITRDGINPTPVVSSFTRGLNLYLYGGLAVSPDRSKIAMGSYGVTAPTFRGGVIIADFDPATGQISNEVIISDPALTVTAWNVCFSPDNSKLYIANAGVYPTAGLYQLDLTNYDSAAIANSFAFISGDAGSNLKLYNDTVYNSNNFHSLNRINQPDLAGAACGWEGNAITLLPATAPRNTLNADVVFPLRRDTIYNLAMDTAMCSSNVTLNAPSDFEAYLWDDGSRAVNRAITAAGTYWVLSKDFCDTRIDTFIVSEIDLIPPVITINARILSTVATYSTYQWLFNGSMIPGATNRSFTVSENGNYQVIVTNEQGCTDTSDVYEVTNASGVGDQKAFEHQIRVYPNPIKERVYVQVPVAVSLSLYSVEGRLISQVEKGRQLEVGALPRGVYLLKIRDLKAGF